MTDSRNVGGGDQPDILRRGLRVLEALAGMEQPASLLAIATAVDLPKASTYRALRALQEEGYVDHLGRRGYRIGSRSIALASLVGPRPALLERARPVLAKLAVNAQETATLHVRSGGYRVLVLGADPRAQRRVHVGERAPLTSGCSGRAILAHLPAAEAVKVLRSHLADGDTDDIERELDAIRADGYALSFSDNHPQFNGIGVALLDPDDGYPLGSLAIAGSDERLSENALRRLFQAKQRAPHKRHAMPGNYDLHREVHRIGRLEHDMIDAVVVDADLPLCVVGPYDASHPVVAAIEPETLAASTVRDLLEVIRHHPARRSRRG